MSARLRAFGARFNLLSDVTGFYVYTITFDQETFGVFATRAAAEQSLKEQIAEGGPAWDGCKIERWLVDGEPERVVSNQDTDPAKRPT